MDTQLTIKLIRRMHASTDRIWQALTDPEQIRKYMFGTHTETTWEKGSSITYSGEFKGKTYKDKGSIVDIIPGKLLHTTHYSPLSGKEDKPENYAHVIYKLEADGQDTIFTLIQDHIETEEQLDHVEENWIQILDGLQQLVEKE